MELVLDTNIVLDHIDRREPFYELSRKVCLLGIVEAANTYISVNMLTDLYYLLCKDFGSQGAQDMIENNLSFLRLVGITPEDARKALAARWGDFEDCLVARCAEKIGADYIVTRNAKDFTASSVEAVTPEELFARLEAQGFVYEEIDW
ncbi:type II toxin-antitoxin system VapC family toxin [Raoultibacter phocaeensis]|uniref:type II toxin-antitoxin system VapC family toxin n=1 Tax=Raoultibacter phocaeensis TaxID=2479841 RepID=UPI00111803AE|nr:PIN domain-containing protein [Raoultibacter phocaeensis]